MKSVFIAAIIAAACSGVAMAGELKLKQAAMSDAEMDRVTAGGPGSGVFTANNHTNNVQHAAPALISAITHVPSGIVPGCGRGTVGGC